MSFETSVRLKEQTSAKMSVPSIDEDEGPLSEALRGTRRAGSRATRIANPNVLLRGGTVVDCALIPAIESGLPGEASCSLIRDVYSSNGKVLLMEAGSLMRGETQGRMSAGGRRLYFIWTSITTPNNVRIPLNSPAVDDLGRSGISGHVDNRFVERFGVAVMVSVIDDVAQALVNATRPSDGQTLNLNGTTNSASEVATEIVKSTIDIAPVLSQHHGARVGVYVARDLDFSDVYTLTTKSAR